MPGAGPGHIKSRYGAKRVIFYFFQPRSKTGAGKKFFSPSLGPGHVKSRCRANGSFSIIFSPGPKLGQDRGT